MKPIILVFIGSYLLSFCILLSASDISEQRKAELISALGRDRNERVDNLPQEEKMWLFKYIHEFRKNESAPSAFDLQLLQLGDEETMARYMEVFDNFPAGSYEVAHSRQPRLIERMAPTMFHDEPASFPQAAGEDTPPLPPRSISAAFIISRVLSTSVEIPEAVRLWAKDILTVAQPSANPDAAYGKMREVMRQWWRDNETAMRAQNWAAVKPGVKIVDPIKQMPAILNEGMTAPPQSGSSSSNRATPEKYLPTVKATEPISDWVYMSIACAAFLFVAAGMRVAIHLRRIRQQNGDKGKRRTD